MKYSWQPKKYIEFVERSPNLFLKDYMEAELDYLTTRIENPKEKIFIEVGAGYGRVVPRLSKISKQIIAVESDQKMLSELKKKGKQCHNVLLIEGDAQNLSELLKDLKLRNPVVLSLQNTLGTPTGDPLKIISEMVKIAQNKGELIISLFIQEGLKDYGISIYDSISELTGKPDLEKTDFTEGIFISETGYRSHWWKPEEREKILKITKGSLVAEIKGEYFCILHIRY